MDWCSSVLYGDFCLDRFCDVYHAHWPKTLVLSQWFTVVTPKGSSWKGKKSKGLWLRSERTLHPLKVVLNSDTSAQSLIPYLFYKRDTIQLFTEEDARHKQLLADVLQEGWGRWGGLLKRPPVRLQRNSGTLVQMSKVCHRWPP